MDTGGFKELLEAVEKLLGGLSEDKPKAAASGKKTGKTLTIISIGKPKTGGLKIPKSAKNEVTEDEEDDEDE